MIKLTNILQDTILYEGLIHSQNIDTTADMLKNWSTASNKFKIVKRPSNAIRLEFTETLRRKEVDNLIQFVNNLGWFISAYGMHDFTFKGKKYNYETLITDIERCDLYWIRIEPKYDLELNKYELLDLSHVSPQKYQEKILKIGLVPKGQGKIAYHPERIYLTKNKSDAIFIAGKFAEFHSGLYDLYQIDIDKLRRKNNGIRFFNDPAFADKGIYTLSNIPPDCITLIDTI